MLILIRTNFVNCLLINFPSQFKKWWYVNAVFTTCFSCLQVAKEHHTIMTCQFINMCLENALTATADSGSLCRLLFRWTFSIITTDSITFPVVYVLIIFVNRVVKMTRQGEQAAFTNSTSNLWEICAVEKVGRIWPGTLVWATIMSKRGFRYKNVTAVTPFDTFLFIWPCLHSLYLSLSSSHASWNWMEKRKSNDNNQTAGCLL